MDFIVTLVALTSGWITGHLMTYNKAFEKGWFKGFDNGYVVGGKAMEKLILDELKEIKDDKSTN